jgi:hypothetical protein
VEAWYQDPYSHNIIAGDNEIDINTPSHMYLQYIGEITTFKVGRFPQKFGPSPTRSLVISGAPWHDAVRFALKTGFLNFTFFASSLNPYLTGAPGTLGENLVDAEWEKQKSTPVSNQRKRIYNKMSKTLFAHRFTLDFHPLEVSIMESIIIGGKHPDFRDINPFIAWHNNYPDGFSNLILSLDAKYQWKTGVLTYGEFAMDDLRGGNAEEKESSANILAYMLGHQHSLKLSDFKFTFGSEWIKTSANYGNRDLPLLKWTSRHALRSNYRLREEDGFGDTYIIDYPLGYFRGSDVEDLWLDFAIYQKDWKWLNSLAYLQTGAKTLASDFNQGLGVNESSPSGLVLEEFRIESDFIYTFKTSFKDSFSLLLGGLWRHYQGPLKNQAPSQNFGLRLSLKANLWWEKSTKKTDSRQSL